MSLGGDGIAIGALVAFDAIYPGGGCGKCCISALREKYQKPKSVGNRQLLLLRGRFGRNTKFLFIYRHLIIHCIILYRCLLLEAGWKVDYCKPWAFAVFTSVLNPHLIVAYGNPNIMFPICWITKRL